MTKLPFPKGLVSAVWGITAGCHDEQSTDICPNLQIWGFRKRKLGKRKRTELWKLGVRLKSESEQLAKVSQLEKVKANWL